jgi:hypothetical protein
MARSGERFQPMPLWLCVFLIWSGSWVSVNAHKHSLTTTLVLYEHEVRVAPQNTVVTTSSPSGNLSTIEFGKVNVVANIVTDEVSINSTKLGKVLGQVTFEKDLSLYLAFTFALSTPSYNGSLTVQGVLDASGNGELVITGGTGDFRWARGYVEVLTLSSTNPADVIFKNTLHIKYD